MSLEQLWWVASTGINKDYSTLKGTLRVQWEEKAQSSWDQYCKVLDGDDVLFY